MGLRLHRSVARSDAGPTGLLSPGKKIIAEEPLLVDQHARIRDVRIDPEGAVYVLTDDTKLLKITPK